tara:strand:+ start:2900 stop:4780 length:1881 start_codon:yes stop_codon:yes gene_type:complete
MANKVVKENEVYLNGSYYPITRPVQQVLASIYPAKVVIGDTTRDSQIRASVISWSDFRGGIGVERMEGAKDVDRAWWSTCSLRYKRHLVLPAKTRGGVANSDATGSSLDIIQEFNGELYCVYSNKKVYQFNTGNDGFGSALDTLPSEPTDALQVRMGGTLYLVIAHGTGYTYTSDASSFTDDTTDAKFLTFWDDKLWGIDNTGQMWYASSIGTEVNDAKLPLPNGHVTDLFVARNASGNPVIYAMTKEGLFAHDFSNNKFVETQLALPFHNENGKGSLRWRDSVYIPAGLGIYKYINGSNSAVVSVVGPDRDDGLPSDNRGSIAQLLGTHNDLIALVDGTLTPSNVDMFASGNESSVIDDSTGFSAILAYNETGWEVKWTAAGTDQGKKITSGFVTDVGGNLSSTNAYRMYWGFNGELYYQQLQSDVINPNQVVNYDYEDSVDGLHYTPHFSADQVEVDKLALELKAETGSCNANQTVKVEYALDYDESTYYTMGTITTNGTTTYTFGSSLGTEFRAIQFKITLATNTVNASPDLINLTLIYRKKLESKFGWSVNIDMNKGYKGNSPKALRSNILSAVQSNTLLEFTFRDDSTTNRNYYVDITSAQGLEHTAYDERGSTQLLLTEP